MCGFEATPASVPIPDASLLVRRHRTLEWDGNGRMIDDLHDEFD